VRANASASQTTDVELVQAIRAGDHRAEFELARRWRSRLIELGRSILGDRDLAEDAAQLALWRAFLHLDRYDDARPFERWMLTIAGNCARDLRRRRARLRTIVDDEQVERAADAGSIAAEPQLGREALDALESCREELDERGRTVVCLYAIGYSLGESGRLLHKPKTTVQSWLKSALDQLRRCLAGKGLADEF